LEGKQPFGPEINEKLHSNLIIWREKRYFQFFETTLVNTNFKDCTKILLQSIKVLAKKWCAIQTHKVLLRKGFKEESGWKEKN
jgi:hypothetical protein